MLIYLSQQEKLPKLVLIEKFEVFIPWWLENSLKHKVGSLLCNFVVYDMIG